MSFIKVISDSDATGDESGLRENPRWFAAFSVRTKREHAAVEAAAGRPCRCLLIATAIAYHNYSIRMAGAFDVIPVRYEAYRSGLTLTTQAAIP
jgi:hypothetical protein